MRFIYFQPSYTSRSNAREIHGNRNIFKLFCCMLDSITISFDDHLMIFASLIPRIRNLHMHTLFRVIVDVSIHYSVYFQTCMHDARYSTRKVEEISISSIVLYRVFEKHCFAKQPKNIGNNFSFRSFISCIIYNFATNND